MLTARTILLVVVPLLALPGAPKVPPRSLAFPDWGFAARFPAAPRQVPMDRQVQTDAGPALIKATAFTSTVAGISFQVTATSYPARFGTTLRLHSRDFLLSARDSMVSTLQGTLVSSRDSVLSGSTGLTFVIRHGSKAAPFRTTVRHFLVGTRGYSIQVVAPESTAPCTPCDAFLGSLTLLSASGAGA